ncbi:MAG: hypothetical protein HYY48_07645 [Gammaproteobacteria bacterium]|nr:hypothetical protein [Gammaproteobacteria bacterium]
MNPSVNIPTLAASLIGTLLACLAGLPAPVVADIDPVNDDTDIFLANPDIPENRPNVLIYVDNTANWNTAFTNEKAALKSVVDNLSDSFNVGLFFFPETGNPNDNVDGGYAKFAVRQMTQDNKTVLSSMVNSLDRTGDAGNNNTLSLGMREVYRYFAGKASVASHGKVKTDYATNATHAAVVANLGDYALDTNTDGTLYNSPIAGSCQSSFVIYISNGGANENTNALEEAEDELDLLGVDTSSTIGITPDGQEGNWMDEWSRYMANADVNEDLDGDQHVYTYTIEVDPTTTGQGDDMTALMESVALQGKGKYFSVSSGNSGQAIINALNQIFQEVQAVNSVFASTTLPVSVNVRGTNLNQVYIGVFRPDEAKEPRWFGNLKMYQLGFDDTTNTLFLADTSGSPAENPETGFINPTSASYWTTSSTFWSYRTAEENGSGGDSDLPDGDLVEKGGAGQQQRLSYASDQDARNLYTCTQGTLSPDCVDGSSLADTPFSIDNDGVSAANLQLGVQAISTLTGFETQTISALSDTKDVASLSTASTTIAVDSLDNGAVTKSVTSLTTTVTKSISALSNNPVSQVATFDHATTGSNKNIITATLNNHGLSSGTTVYITGSAEPDYNGSWTITKIDDNSFKFTISVQNADRPESGTVTTTSSIVTATVTDHGFTGGQSVTVAGVTPTSFNGTYNNITKVDDDTFTFTTAAPLAPVTSVSGATAQGQTTTATGTVSSHGYSVGDFITIAGVTTPTDYNGVHEILSVPTSDTFTFSVSSGLANASGTITSTRGSTTVLVTALGHAFADGQTVTITGSDVAGYNGSFVISNVVLGVSFEYTTTTALAPNTSTSVVAAGGTSTGVTAIVYAHKFGNPGDTVDVIIDGATPSAAYDGTVTATIVDENTFTYPTEDGSAPVPATGDAITARLFTDTAFATVTGHGYGSAGDTFTVTVTGATQEDYNETDVTATVVDDDTFSYPISTGGVAAGPASGTLESKIKTTTAHARAATHGFADGASVTIAGANQDDFNGTFTITLVDANNFTYTIPNAQGDATGTLVATGGSPTGSERDNLIEWVRGADNFEDEDIDSENTDVRASTHGDVLHSRPAVVNYNRHGNDDDVYIYYGSNDGIFRAVKGGFNQSDTTEPMPGQEAWGFIPEEFFSSLERLRDNEPIISSSNKKPYFADGSIGTYVVDADGDEKLDVTDEPDDTVDIFISMRRGGRFIYALDVSDPADPKLLWKRSNDDAGWGELGYTWSVPRIWTLNANSGDPVLIFGAGYDPELEDIDPATIVASSATGVTYGSGATEDREMGRGIFVVDALTGDLLWQAGPAAADPTGETGVSHVFVEVTGMDYAIPSDVTVIADRNSSGGTVRNRAYVGDTGGNIWRIDMEDVNVANWTVTKLASIADTSGLTGVLSTSDQSGLRKFLFPPDVVYHEDGYDAVLIGSGDREHPFDDAVDNRMYMFKDSATGTTPIRGTGTDPGETTIGEADLFNATSNCIQDSDACDSEGGETPTTALADLESADGWLIELADGEKVVGNAVTLNNVTFFNTNQPSESAPTSCTSDLGIARQYRVLFDDATAILDQNIDGFITALDRAEIHPGGGYLPSPVPVVVEIDGQTHEGVISGVAVDQPPGSLLNARLRKFWYKEME